MDVAQAIARAAGKLTESEFRARLAKEREATGGLLDDEALALLVLDELGLNDGAYVTLAQAQGRSEATVRVTIDRLEPPREFAREGRPPGRVANVTIADSTGLARLVLWDRDAEKAEDGTLREGARVTVVNARVKEGRWGLELHVSPWTALEVEGAPDAAKRKLLADQRGVDPTGAPLPDEGPRERDVVGRVLALGPTRTSIRPGGGVQFLADLDLDTEDGRVRVVLRDEPVRQARAFFAGSHVRVTACSQEGRGWMTTKASRVEAAA